jgi:hypothetical protein
LRFWRESSLIIPKNYDAPRRHGIPLPMLSSQTRFSYCLTGPKLCESLGSDLLLSLARLDLVLLQPSVSLEPVCQEYANERC